MSDNYTRGTWAAVGSQHYKANPWSVVVRKPGVNAVAVANIPNRRTIPAEEQLANARLISAAPDLLEALKAMLRCCYDVERDDETLAAVLAAEAAIRKGTRRT